MDLATRGESGVCGHETYNEVGAVIANVGGTHESAPAT